MKKFFDDIKKDIKFKSAGPGKKLTDDRSSSKPQAPKVPHGAPRKTPTEGAEKAGAAALARIEQQHRPVLKTSQDAIRNQVKRELEAEAAATAASLKNTDVEGSGVPQKDLSCFSVSGVFFICPLTGKTLTKTEREMHIKEAILMRFSEDAIEASIMMIHTFNKDKEKVKAAVDVISKYVENICKNPTEEKYRKIKLSNKVFQEKVSGIEGSREYLQALGFESTTLPVDGEDRTEEFLVLPAQESEVLEQMKAHLERLQKGEPVRAKLDHQTQVFRPSQHATHFQLPPDFYNLTAEELKREQQLKSEIVERNTMLRTKAMREKDEQRERRKYNYVLLRVRLPDENILQGTFLAWERVAALYQFVRDSLENGWQPFELMAPGGQKLKDDEELALNECNLAPAAELTFSWDAAVQADIAAAGGKNAILLKAALLENIKILS
ncbi:UBX domain-containing protein 6 isoform X1 [Sinocyclocheilus grahami]|uniref:UBX domain-containing protein 6 n=1 Tax=Sinocyclocheilus grahami TaxID=75366 RepID=A0A672PJ53_SINGR|nr:PREDICTED: UBX domain-containing protein 6-like isoform X1 [Sinocyclocheilus grahami]XP_016129259.1 PREDICTED: UBX domain-containing protein 6-like isoform X1 [Sinocyclocheilus grahami]